MSISAERKPSLKVKITDTLPTFDSRPSFEQKDDVIESFKFDSEAKKSKKGTLQKSKNATNDSPQSATVVDSLDLEKPTKGKKKKKKASQAAHNTESKDDSEAKKKAAKEFRELSTKTTIVEDLHIQDAWGAVSPRARKFEDSGSPVGSPVGSPRLLNFNQADSIPLSDEDVAVGGLLAHDDVEERVERIQKRRFTESDAKVDLYLEKHSAKSEMKQILESIEQQEKDLPENIRRLLVEANLGWNESQFTLGYCYDTGSGGVIINTENAIHWYQEAALAGHVTAQNNLGVLLATGHRNRIKPNPAEAFRWYEKAAQNGHPNAQFHLGLACLKGEGVEHKDDIEAFKWFKLAAKQGHILSQANIGAMYMSGQGTQQDFEKARKWSKRAASQGSAIAHHNLAVIFHKGYGVKQDPDAVRDHLREAFRGNSIPKQLSDNTMKSGNTLMNM